MSTIEEMMKTFECAWRDHVDAEADAEFSLRDEAQVALTAVIEKHIGPMLADAYRAGQLQGNYSRMVGHECKAYTARILSAITATGRE